MKPLGVILAGGRARRLGGEKALLSLAGQPLLAHVIDRLRPQVEDLVLNANGDPARFAAWPLAVVADPIEDQPGPLAGILAGMHWATTAHPNAAWIATAPVDTPFLPRDLVARLMAAAPEHDVVLASRHGWRHPVVGVWSLGLRAELEKALRDGVRKVDDCARHFRLATVAFDAEAPIDPFFNVNTPADLETAEAYARLSPDARLSSSALSSAPTHTE
jgi:molybdopterin-guanine dinucleotide biosynthesis protein A